MRLKRFTGVNLREAVDAVRRELGEEAVIVQTRRLRATGWRRLWRRCDQVLVVAAVDEAVAGGRPAVDAASRTVRHSGAAGFLRSWPVRRAGPAGPERVAPYGVRRRQEVGGSALAATAVRAPGFDVALKGALVGSGWPVPRGAAGREPAGADPARLAAAGAGVAGAPGVAVASAAAGLPGVADDPGLAGLPGVAGVLSVAGAPGEVAVPGESAVPGEAAVPGESGRSGGSRGGPATGGEAADGFARGTARDDLLRRVVVLPEALGVPRPVAVRSGRRLAVVLVGPTGGGKTTTVAKLAAHLRFEQGWRVGLVTADTFRAGGVEQLEAYARLLGLPCEVAATPRALERALGRFADCEAVLVDTSGRGHRDASRMDELHRFIESAREVVPLEVQLVLPATLRLPEARATAAAFRALGADRLILTKLDECEARYAGLEVAAGAELPCSYTSSGQRVPEDLAAAWPDRLAAWAEGDAGVPALSAGAASGETGGLRVAPSVPVAAVFRPAAAQATRRAGGRRVQAVDWAALAGGVDPAGARDGRDIPGVRTRGGDAHVEGSAVAR